MRRAWAVEQWKQFRPPMLTCEPVLAEAAFLLQREGRGIDALFALLERGILRIGFAAEDHQADLRALLRRHRNRVTSLADACLVRLAEIHTASEALTLDDPHLKSSSPLSAHCLPARPRTEVL